MQVCYFRGYVSLEGMLEIPFAKCMSKFRQEVLHLLCNVANVIFSISISIYHVVRFVVEFNFEAIFYATWQMLSSRSPYHVVRFVVEFNFEAIVCLCIYIIQRLYGVTDVNNVTALYYIFFFFVCSYKFNTYIIILSFLYLIFF